jgi:hypothetical protein
MRPTLSSLADLLRWSVSPATAASYRSWQTTYDELLVTSFGKQVCGNAIVAAAVAALRNAVSLLPTSHVRALLRTPTVAALMERVQCGDQASYAELAALISVQLRSKDAIEFGGFGDRRLQVSPTPLDCAGLLRFRENELGLGRLIPLEPHEVDRTVERLEAAMGVVNLVPAAASVVDSFVQIVALRKQPANANALYSSSASKYIGLVILTNAHIEQVDAIAIASRLVHEAVHHLLYTYEEVAGRFVRSAASIQLESTWSGKRLELRTYVHACFVWYALYWFGRTLLTTRANAAYMIRPIVTKSMEGFLKDPIGRILDDVRHVLSADVCEALCALRQTMAVITSRTSDAPPLEMKQAL